MRLLPLLKTISLTVPRPRINPAAVRFLYYTALGVVLFVASTALPSFTAGPEADQGWPQLLAHLSTRGARFGVDFVFCYGPLYDLVLGPYEPALFWQKYAVEILGKLAMTLLLLRQARQLTPTAGGLWLAAISLLLLALPLHTELAILAGVAALIVPLRKDRISIPDLAIAAVYLAAISLSKFTCCPFSIAGLGVMTLAVFVREARWKAVLPFAIYSLALAGFFVLRDQRLGDLPQFLASGFAYSASYGGMALEGPTFEVRLALAILTILAVAAWPLTRKNLPATAILAITAALYWKAGFVRHDSHALSFFVMMLLVSALVVTERRGLIALATLLAGVGLAEVLLREKLLGTQLVARWPEKLNDLLHPGEVQARLERQRLAMIAKHDLPRIRAAVGTATIDVFTDCQGIALLNGLNVVPRPTLQSVNAVRGEWLDRNAAGLRSDDAPRFLLVNWISFDLRYPTLTDGPALLAMLEHYDFRLEEQGYLLLERRESPRSTLRQSTFERSASIDEIIELDPLKPGEYRTLSIDVESTAGGRLRAAAYRPPVLFFLVRDEAGDWHPYRLVAEMARREFLLDPLCAANGDLRTLFETTGGRRVTAIKLHVMRSERGLVAAEYRLTISTLSRGEHSAPQSNN